MQNFDKFLAGCKASNPRKVLLLQKCILLNPKNKGTTVLRNIGSQIVTPEEPHLQHHRVVTRISQIVGVLFIC